MMAAGGWRPADHLPERQIMTVIGPLAVRCPRVGDRGSEGSERQGPRKRRHGQEDMAARAILFGSYSVCTISGP
jgi:hypothetical protein